jgi:transposase
MDIDVAVVEEDLRSSRKSTPELRGEVLSGPERRRRWSDEEKLRVLAQSIAPGSSVSLVCRMHGISTGRLATLAGRSRW